MSLRKQALSGMVWTFADQFGTQLISFTISIILARLLVPKDFGTIALFGVVIGIASTLIDGGMASSLIRTKDADEMDLSTVFWFNIAVSLVLYGTIFFIAPFISKFYKLLILTPIIRVYSLVIIINAFVVVQKTHFIKELNFKTAFKIQLPSLIIGGISGIGFAYSGFGVWSLVYSALIQTFIFTTQHWVYSDWKPKFIFDKKKFRYHFKYGYKMTLSGLLDITFRNVYTIVIGKFYSIQQLGFYSRADSLKQLPVTNLSNALNKVSFPLFAKISHDNVRLKQVYKKLMKVVIFIIAPVLAMMVVSAEPLIRFLLTDKWLPIVPYFQILSFAGLLYPIHAYNLNILKVKGRSDLFLRLEVIKKLVFVLTISVSLRFGIYGLLWGQCVTSTIAFFINTHYTGKFLNYNSVQQILDLFPTILLVAIIGAVTFGLDQYFLTNFLDWVRIILIVFIYIILYLALVLLFKFKEIDYIKELIKK
ncbi:lipopolysaccharide biosynthesis protein [Epilithonimonas arachidiradicis]|uniref:Lipopolysaccharide biosynthesis protein n=1 Tax=Epilithonimonas arachidiradicis TaxID=1617282 RepID=A0A420CJC0_9FLAO|nr:lipopolysaccharide biosynthesis protein [Epilithonimonas arachidiradicis]RKE78383.1 O-antigen/teichoic acid export membrane protein [Epilithonimonas arachidiradicis]GGG67281.1 lipopolysaccharide biosynthesis protein [Epilithonimonas arachidiradicis]